MYVGCWLAGIQPRATATACTSILNRRVRYSSIRPCTAASSLRIAERVFFSRPVLAAILSARSEMPTSSAIIAIVTSSSTSVNPRRINPPASPGDDLQPTRAFAGGSRILTIAFTPATDSGMDDFISLADAAKLFEVHRQQVHRWLAEGRLKSVTIAGRRVLRRKGLKRPENKLPGRKKAAS